MHYEEQYINGRLMCRTMPRGQWHECSAERLHERVGELLNPKKPDDRDALLALLGEAVARIGVITGEAVTDSARFLAYLNTDTETAKRLVAEAMERREGWRCPNGRRFA